MSEHYYNTNRLTGNGLQLADADAETQEDIILTFFQAFPESNYTPFEIAEGLFSSAVPITSIRRAMTNLTKKEKLVKTDIMRPGAYGKQCHAWRLA